MNGRADALAVGFLVALGATLRAPLLWSGLWRDEASTYYESSAKTVGAVLEMVRRGELNPPAFFLLEHAWTRLFGVSDVALKVTSFVASLALIPVTYWLGRRLLSGRGALLAALFAAVSPTCVLMSAEARPYALVGTLAGLALLAYAAALTASRPRAWLATLAVVLAALLYTHYTGALAVALLAAATLFVFRSTQGWRLVALAVALAAACGLFAPWVPTMAQHAHIGLPWSPRTTPATLLDAVNDNVTSLLPLAGRHSQLGIAFAAVLLLVAAWRLSGRRADGGPKHDIVFAFAACVIAGAFAEALLSMREPRFMHVFAPAAWIWFAALLEGGIAAVTQWHARWRILVVALAVALLLALMPKEIAARRVERLAASGMPALAPTAETLARRYRTLFIVVPDYLGPSFGYYIGRTTGAAVKGFARWDDPQLFVPSGYLTLWEAPDLVDRAEAGIAMLMRSHDRLCVVRDRSLRDSGLMPFSRSIELMTWLRARYRRLFVTDEEGRLESVTLEVFSNQPA